MAKVRSKLPEREYGAILLQEAVNIPGRLSVPGSYVQDKFQGRLIAPPDHFYVNPKQALGVKSHKIILPAPWVSGLAILFTVKIYYGLIYCLVYNIIHMTTETKLKKVMRTQGRKINWLAAKIGITPVLTYKYVDGSRRIPSPIQTLISEALEVKSSLLF